MNGVINIYKERGFTSFDVVARLRRILKQKKIGHTGTLDPDATGVLPVCIGQATALCEMLTDHTKEYTAGFVLGKRTDTLDIWGEVQQEDIIPTGSITESMVRDALGSFKGGYMQTPPMYSSKKINGKKLYEYARQGQEIERKPVFVDISEISLTDYEEPAGHFTVECGKGTYIRSLIDDMGKKLGTCACMTSLERIRVGEFGVKEAVTLDQVQNIVDSGEALPLHSIDSFFEGTPAFMVKQEDESLLMNGNGIPSEKLIPKDTFRNNGNYDRAKKFYGGRDICLMYDRSGIFRALYHMKGDTAVPVKMFLNND